MDAADLGIGSEPSEFECGAAAAELESSRRRKAVWETLNSAATACIHTASTARAASSRTHIAAGLPLNASAMKASTCDDDHAGDRESRHMQRLINEASGPLLSKYPLKNSKF